MKNKTGKRENGGCHWPLGDHEICIFVMKYHLNIYCSSVRPSGFGLMKYHENCSRCLNGLLSDNSLTGSCNLHILGGSICYKFLVEKQWIFSKNPEILKLHKTSNEPLQILNDMFSNLAISFYLHIFDGFISNIFDGKMLF